MRFFSIIRGLLIAAILPLVATSCNEDSSTTSVYVDYGTLAVTKFSVRYPSEKSRTASDTAYFSIDLNNGVIFNADSIRPGVDVSKLVTSISYNAAVDSVLVIMDGGTTRTGRVDYKKNPGDSIDYTGRVSLLLKYGDMQKEYRVRLNVHKEYADSLRWDEANVRPLPSLRPDPTAQKTILLDNGVAVSLIREADGAYTFARSDDAFQKDVESGAAHLPFTPRIESLSVAGDKIYLLSDSGELWQSSDQAATWTTTGQTWENVIGPYLETIVGIRLDGDKRLFAQYPVLNLNEKELPADFPVDGFSNFVTLQNKWTLSPVAFFMGGVKTDGKLSPATWAFDGAEWICLNDGDIDAMEQASIIPYYYYRRNIHNTGDEEFRVWMLIGGRKADNSINRNVYISYDNGVSWRLGKTSLQLPECIPAMWGCDNIVVSTKLDADLSDNWSTEFKSSTKQRIPWQVEGGIISWNCPYIYLIGGYGPDGKLYNTIWRGVLNRLTFTPII